MKQKSNFYENEFSNKAGVSLQPLYEEIIMRTEIYTPVNKTYEKKIVVSMIIMKQLLNQFVHRHDGRRT